MPLSELLNEVATLSGLQHQRMADQLAAKVAKSNIDIATQAVLGALPSDARGDYLSAVDTGNWQPLADKLPNSIDMLKTLTAQGRTPAGIPPEIARESMARTLTGDNTGQIAKAGVEKTAYEGAAALPTMSDPDFLANVLTTTLTGQTPGAMQVDKAFVQFPGLAQHKASDEAGVTMPAGTAAQIAAGVSGEQASNETANRRINMEYNINASNQALEQLKLRFAASGGKSDQSLQWATLWDKAQAELDTGRLNPSEQLKRIQMINLYINKLIESGDYTPEQGAALQINPNNPGTPGSSSPLRKLFPMGGPARQ